MTSSDRSLPWRQPPGHWTRRGACPEALRLGLGGQAQSPWPAADWRDQEQYTLWHYWACSPQPATLWPLMQQHANPALRDALSQNGAHPWHWLALHGAAEALTLWQEAWGAPAVNAWQGDTVLHCAAWSADLATLKMAIAQAGDRLAERDAQGIPPLVVAVYRGSMPHVMALLEAGVDPDVQDPHGRSALHHAALQGDVSLLGAMEDAGGNVSLPDREGDTPQDVLDDRQEISPQQLSALRLHWLRRYQHKLRF